MENWFMVNKMFTAPCSVLVIWCHILFAWLFQVLMLADGDTESFLCQRLPVLSSMSQLRGVATAYVCQDFTCSLPVTDPQELRRLLLDGATDTQIEWQLNKLTEHVVLKNCSCQTCSSSLVLFLLDVASESGFAITGWRYYSSWCW